MTKPLNHSRDLIALACEQLRAQYPSASSDLIRDAAKAKQIPSAKVIPFPRGWQFAGDDFPHEHGKGQF